MNKKILSLAVAAVVAAPMAASAADVSVNGAYNMAVFNTNEALNTATSPGGSGGKASGGLAGADYGSNKLEINVKSGDAFAKLAWGIGSDTSLLDSAREVMAGTKMGGVSVAIGRQANMYNNGVKVDTMTATFLEARGHSGGVGKVSSFVSGLLGFSGAAGDVKWGLQYGPAYVDSAGAKNPTMAHVNFKAGPASVGVGYEQDTSGNSSTGLSAKMKFGDVAVAASFENVDGGHQGDGAAGAAQTVIFADVSMPLGGGTIGLGLGSNTTASKTFSRVSYSTTVGGATVYAGVASDGASNQRTGAGLMVKF